MMQSTFYILWNNPLPLAWRTSATRVALTRFYILLHTFFYCLIMHIHFCFLNVLILYNFASLWWCSLLEPERSLLHGHASFVYILHGFVCFYGSASSSSISRTMLLATSTIIFNSPPKSAAPPTYTYHGWTPSPPIVRAFPTTPV